MKLTIFVLVLVMVASMSFGIDFGGSTAVAGVVNAEAQRVEVDQDIDVDIGLLHIDLTGGVDYAGEDILADYSLGASITFSVFKLGGSIAGNQGVAMTDVKAFLDIATGDVGADVDVKLSADPEADVFQGVEFSAFYNPGPLEFRVGYLLTTIGAGDVNVPEVFDAGGIYAKAKFTY